MTTERRRILVVDDDAPLRKVLRIGLTASRFLVEETASAEAALRLIPEQAFDLALLDVNIPDMSGFELCGRIRSLAPRLGIVMVTVRNAEKDVVQAFEAGADDYIVKPFRFPELTARLSAVLRRTHSGSTEKLGVLRARDLEMDLDRRLVLRTGKAVHLSPIEFELLALLMKNEGVPLTHGKLLHEIWGAEYGGELEYLRSYVKTLRKKIESDPARPAYVLTEPRVGYKFCNPSDPDLASRHTA
jgi:two-component system, OmpR family, KDP operon response regulator KdpE